MINTIIIIGVVLLIVLWVVSIYNNMVRLRNNRENAFSNIDVQLKQRYDLVPQLVSTVKGYAKHESELLTRVTEARAACMSATDINGKIEADNALSSALAGLKVSVEAYPDLKANQNFLELQAQLEGTENRIAVARKDFNAAAQQYNVSVRRFPANLVARMFGFGQKPYFESAEGAAAAPQVTF